MPPSPQRHRKSIRLKGYDYTQPGGYFVTLATDRHQCFFGERGPGAVSAFEHSWLHSWMGLSAGRLRPLLHPAGVKRPPGSCWRDGGLKKFRKVRLK